MEEFRQSDEQTAELDAYEAEQEMKSRKSGLEEMED